MKISAKVTVWSVAALLISLGVFIGLANSVIIRLLNESYTHFNQFFLRQAIHAYQTGGSSALAQYLGDINPPEGIQFHLVNSQGRDLATGEDRSDMIRNTRGEHRSFQRMKGRFTFAVSSDDSRYVLLVTGKAPSLGRFAAFYLLLLATVATLYWLVTTKIASPLRHLGQVVHRFGRGELTARADAKSRDEVGDLARDFNSMAERIGTLLTTERQLLQDVSHELRSPLARLTFEAEMVRKSTDRDASATRLRHEIDRLAELVGTLIEMARVEGDLGAIEMGELSVNDVLQTVVEDCEVEARERGCSISMTLAECGMVRGNPELLRRGVENVVRNAIRYAPTGTAVEVSSQCESNALVVSVRDRGPGIPGEMLEKVFDPFFRVDASREERTGGLGLGLAIARRAIRVHQGDITAENASPGALFRITLPA